MSVDVLLRAIRQPVRIPRVRFDGRVERLEFLRGDEALVDPLRFQRVVAGGLLAERAFFLQLAELNTEPVVRVRSGFQLLEPRRHFADRGRQLGTTGVELVRRFNVVDQLQQHVTALFGLRLIAHGLEHRRTALRQCALRIHKRVHAFSVLVTQPAVSHGSSVDQLVDSGVSFLAEQTGQHRAQLRRGALLQLAGRQLVDVFGESRDLPLGQLGALEHLAPRLGIFEQVREDAAHILLERVRGNVFSLLSRLFAVDAQLFHLGIHRVEHLVEHVRERRVRLGLDTALVELSRHRRTHDRVSPAVHDVARLDAVGNLVGELLVDRGRLQRLAHGEVDRVALPAEQLDVDLLAFRLHLRALESRQAVEVLHGGGNLRRQFGFLPQRLHALLVQLAALGGRCQLAQFLRCRGVSPDAVDEIEQLRGVFLREARIALQGVEILEQLRGDFVVLLQPQKRVVQRVCRTLQRLALAL